MQIFTSYFSDIKDINSDLITIFLYSNNRLFNKQILEIKKLLPEEIDRILKLEKFRAESESSIIIYTNKSFKSPRIQLFGLGEKEKLNYESFRKASALSCLNANKLKIQNITFLLPDLPDGLNLKYLTQSIFEGAFLSQYKFDKFLTSTQKTNRLKKITLAYNSKKLKDEINSVKVKTQILCDAVLLARDLSNMPANQLNPDLLAKYAKKSAKSFNYKAEVWDENKIKKTGFGGLVAVGSGSNHPPRFIILKYYGNKNKKMNIVLVGKGITFDSGGLSLKSAENMAEMKMDMSGAAVVLATVQCAARMKLPVNLIGLIPACENMPGGSALKPGDIIKHYGGKTSEVANTDAEGRLILADALAYAHKLKPELVIDIATLTGAVISALGHHVAAILGNDRTYIDKIKNAGDVTYERVWELPLYDEYKKQIKSEVADVRNLGTRGAGVITAAMFLKSFISDKNKKEYKWIHIDIAGTAIIDEGAYYIQSGASGFGVRLLIEFLRTNFK